ncbi:tRNA lysidine(34) synthetase TilS [Salinicoccus sp. RF5]|uniref:tRNA lysidine(34) synthetase TilS n=1 Tax=Salinicoccus sp. RF5 TaxID=2748874 RepID=UPI001E3AA772|nr:tRNA lysidine(34) synthetase TilS [Salinicoccus sp. RF5]MCC4722763.1 tRNA lysidine(34) synthetase TilS [Salinicoccus sp. RF5]
MELFRPWGEHETVALAISGGVDSMVLYHLLSTTHAPGRLILLHVNHGQRAASVEEAAYIEKMAQQAGHLCEVETLSIPPDAFSQERARQARYHFFDVMMRRHGADVLITAHHLDDQYETILHSLLSGRHLPGAMGIPAERCRKGYRIVRPLISVSREEIEAYAQRHGVVHFEDETNSRTDYTRNYIRHRLMKPIKESANLQEAHLIRLRDDMAEIDDILQAEAEAFLEGRGKTLPRDDFNAQKHIIRLYIMQAWLKAEGVEPRRRYLEEIMSVIASDTANASFEAGEMSIVISYDHITRRQGEGENESMLMIEGDGSHVFNGYRITSRLEPHQYPLMVRTKESGDRMQIPGLGTKKLSRIFIDGKVPKDEREKMPVILDSDRQIIALGEIYNIMGSKEMNSRLLIEKEFTDEP